MTQREPKELNSFKDIEGGAYRNHYLIYNRKSTDEPENQKNSIKYQKSENARFAYRAYLPVADITIEGFCTNGIISEKHSAFKEDADLIFSNNGIVQFRIERPKFYKLSQLLNNGYFKGVIVLCWDRISRNKGDETIINKLMKAGVDFRFVLATYDKTSAGALHMDIDGMFAEHHSRVTSEKVSLTIRNQREKGICTYKAPVGYLNEGSMENKPFDPERSPIIRQLFELYSTGEWTLADLAKWAIDQGFTMSPSRRRRTVEEKLAEEDDDIQIAIEPIARPPTYTGIQKILTNPFYTGKILDSDGVYIRSHSHQALVSEELFNKVQHELRRKKISVHYLQRLDHPLRGMVRCGECKRLYTPYLQKGKVYFGARCAPSCTNSHKNFTMDFIASEIGRRMNDLSFTDDELEEINARTSTDIALFEVRRFNELEVNERQKKKLREDLAYLRSNRLTLLKTGVYTPEGFVQEECRLVENIKKLQDAEQTSDIAMHETIMDVMKLSEQLKHLTIKYDFAHPYEKEEIINCIFSELFIYKKDLKYKCRNGFQALESRFISDCDPTTWLSELHLYQIAIRDSLNEIKKYCNTL